MRPRIDVLWTGGWDSTYRVISAAMVNHQTVVPHYIVDLGRGSSLRELQAISEVRAVLAGIDPEAAARIEPLRITPVTEIPKNHELTGAWQRLTQQAHLGSQYDWLARYASSEDIRHLELSVHVDDKAYHFLKGRVMATEDGSWTFDDRIDADEAIFRFFDFPLLQISKTQMKAEAERHGFIEALERSWFCYSPIDQAPCGLCNPCRYTIEEGMAYRLPEKALRRHRTRHLRRLARAPRALWRRASAALSS
ncbi:7-cyano-7-deazaguanine synthase [Kushneria phyllosphaerae]|uniref:7-cyano-7-deazaguanine synthase n=1 Tax=Kushneria phyllosphaerae TaxID=2100822 RepID=A0A2R8CNA8_9GAMM|nr:7-cyano-7-deazaguanine synthase [Kushneria phyllosphaerae]SPJ34264.1 7-cyano-7-deazaguanine synthase [Kushneria phyllosphaerae]